MSPKEMEAQALRDFEALREKYVGNGRRFPDAEEWHLEADGILLRFVPESVAAAWEEVEKWYA